MNYVDYEYYLNTWRGDLNKEQFDRQITRASDYINTITFNRIAAPFTEAVKKAVCSVIDEMQAQNNIKSNGRVTTYNNDGYSETVSYGSDPRSNARKLRECASLYLAHTGLLYRGANYVGSK